MTHQQIAPVRQPDPGLASLLRRAALAWHEPNYEARLEGADVATDRFQLLWPKP